MRWGLPLRFGCPRYRDDDWGLPKPRLNRQQLAEYRNSRTPPASNRALAACTASRDILIVESGHDHLVPHAVTETI
jgi:uncharacterized protein